MYKEHETEGNLSLGLSLLVHSSEGGRLLWRTDRFSAQPCFMQQTLFPTLYSCHMGGNFD